MSNPCETVSKSFLPTLRARVAKELISNYGFSQVKAAELLGTTQAAISQYMSKKRGSQIFKEVTNNNLLKIEASKIAKQLEVINEHESFAWKDKLARLIIKKFVPASFVQYGEESFHGMFADYANEIEKLFDAKLLDCIAILHEYDKIASQVPKARKVLKSFLGHMLGAYHFAPKKNIHTSKAFLDVWEARESME